MNKYTTEESNEENIVEQKEMNSQTGLSHDCEFSGWELEIE